jgi:hypothetical protein
MSQERQYKAFVSSTYTDLKDHRAHVIRTLRASGIHVDPMEDWTADGDEPKVFSKERVTGCDVCILLVAFRRGHVPAGEQRSITQLEHDYALGHGIEVLAFLLDEDAPWSRRFDEMDRDVGEFGIREWRRQLRERHGVGTFGQAPSSVEVGPAITRWLQKPQGTQARAQAGSIAALDFQDFLEEKRQLFTGREWLFTAVENWCVSGSEPALLITGDPGIGKSAIVAELVHRHQNTQVLAWHCCRSDMKESLRPGRFVRSLAANIVRGCQTMRRAWTPRPSPRRWPKSTATRTRRALSTRPS